MAKIFRWYYFCSWGHIHKICNDKYPVLHSICLTFPPFLVQAFSESRILKQEIEGLSGGPHLHVLNKASELNSLPMTKLKQLQSQLRTDLERVEKVSSEYVNAIFIQLW